jgi:DNA-binding IclR family transcriptional regulator
MRKLTAKTLTEPARLRQQLDEVRHDGIAFDDAEAALGHVLPEVVEA